MRPGPEGKVRTSPIRRDFLASLTVLGFLAALVLVGLAVDGNWGKFLRVLLAFLTYGAVLLALLRGLERPKEGSHLSFWPFAAAAAAAELTSGWLHPNASARVVLATAPVAALLLGGVHWLALRAWRTLRRRATAGRLDPTDS